MFCCVFSFEYTIAPWEGIQNSLGFWIPCRGYRSLGIGFQIRSISGIPNSLNCIPDSKAQDSRRCGKSFLDSGSHKQKCPWFQILLYEANTNWEIQAKRLIISQAISAFPSASLLRLLPIYTPYVKHVIHRPECCNISGIFFVAEQLSLYEKELHKKRRENARLARSHVELLLELMVAYLRAG